MAWRKAVGVLGVLVVVAIAAGAVWNLASGTLVSDRAVATTVTIALVVVSVAVVSVLGSKSPGWLENPYW